MVAPRLPQSARAADQRRAPVQTQRRRDERAISSEELIAVQLRLHDPLQSMHVGAECFWDRDRSICLLIVLDNGNQRATDCEAGPIERVDELRFAGPRWTELDVSAARLERLGVAAG